MTAGLDIDVLLIHNTFTQVSQWGLTYIHTCQSYVHMPCADSSDFGLLGELSSQKYVIPCFVRRWTDQKNLTSLALSSSEKSITIQTNKQTVNDISTPHIAYRHVWMTNARQFNSHVPGKHGLSSFPLINLDSIGVMVNGFVARCPSWQQQESLSRPYPLFICRLLWQGMSPPYRGSLTHYPTVQ